MFLGLCNIYGWRKWHRSHNLARFGRNFVCQVTYLPISPQERPRFELSYRGNLQQPVEFKIITDRPPPVEFAQWLPVPMLNQIYTCIPYGVTGSQYVKFVNEKCYWAQTLTLFSMILFRDVHNERQKLWRMRWRIQSMAVQKVQGNYETVGASQDV